MSLESAFEKGDRVSIVDVRCRELQSSGAEWLKALLPMVLR